MARIKPHRVVLENGLVVLTLERRDAPVDAVLISYRAGAYFDPPGLSGLAHLTEHMMFRGTGRFPQGRIDALTGRLGGANNAMTTADHALYYFVLPSGHWRMPLEIEADRMLHCELSRAAFETERRVAMEERMMLDDDPETLVYEAVDALAFGEHPYARPVAGTLGDIERMTVDDLQAFYRRHYAPANAVLSVAGDVDHNEIEAAAEALFGAAPPGSAAAHLEAPPVPPDDCRNMRIRRALCPPMVTTAFISPAASHQDAPALELVAAHLSSGRSSALYRGLVEGSKMATEASASRLMQADPGLFYISASLHEGVSPESCEEAMLGIVSSLRESGLKEEELTRARNLTTVDALLSLESCLGAAGAAAFWELLGSWRLEEAYEERIATVDIDAVHRVAGLYLSPGRRTSAWLVP